MKHTLYILLATCLLFASCEKTVQIKLPPFKQQPVINTSTLVGDSLVVQLGLTHSLTSVSTLDTYKVKVKLYENGTYVGELQSQGLGMSISLFSTSKVMKAGNKYRLEVITEQYGTATAETVVPDVVRIDSVKHESTVRVNKDGLDQDALTIYFKDPPSKGDYYLIRVIRADSFGSSTETFCVNTTDPYVETLTDESIDINLCIQGDMFLRDEYFNGGARALKLYVPTVSMLPREEPWGDTVWTRVELLHLTEAGFRYRKSLQSARDNNDNPFSEPVNVYTNVMNGYGMFSIDSRDYRIIRE